MLQNRWRTCHACFSIQSGGWCFVLFTWSSQGFSTVIKMCFPQNSSHSIFNSIFMAISEKCTVAPRKHESKSISISTFPSSFFFFKRPPFCVNSSLVKYISSLFRAAYKRVSPHSFCFCIFMNWWVYPERHCRRLFCNAREMEETKITNEQKKDE